MESGNVCTMSLAYWKNSLNLGCGLLADFYESDPFMQLPPGTFLKEAEENGVPQEKLSIRKISFLYCTAIKDLKFVFLR